MSSTSSIFMNTDEWLRAASHRRTIYGLGGTSAIPDNRVMEIIKAVQSFAPSAYNSQPVRFTLATGEKHKQLWDTISQAAEPLLNSLGEETRNGMLRFLQGHKAAYGSIIIWESGEAQQQGMERHKSAAPLFPQYGDHASGMAQLLIWTALELEGLGANLQHMQSIPSVEAALKEFCDVPKDYSLKAHLNYGDKSQPHPDIPSKLYFAETFNQI